MIEYIRVKLIFVWTILFNDHQKKKERKKTEACIKCDLYKIIYNEYRTQTHTHIFKEKKNVKKQTKMK